MSTAAGKRPLYDDDEDEDSLFVSQTARKKRKSEAPEGSVSDDTEEGRRASLRDPDDSDDEAAEDEEEDEEYESYSEQQEQFPNHPAFDKQIPEVEKMLAELAKDAMASVNDAACDSAQVNELREMAKNISLIPEHTRQMIGLIGDAGEGKSSLVNTLCDCPNLAKALDAGKSCTYVITKYERAASGQKLKLSSTVEFYDSNIIGSLLSKALDDWHTFYHEPDDAWTTAEVEQHESRASTCLSMFRALFSHYAELRTDELATATLHQMSQRREEKLTQVQTLVTRAKEFLQRFQRADGVYAYYHEADSTEDLWEELDQFVTQGTDPDEPTPWPLVKQVSIGVQGSRVLDSYVLVDMPGISDTNELRVDATQQFIKQCDHLMVVARAGRVTTNPVVRSILKKYGKALDGNVMVVSTKSDENISHNVAIEMSRLGFDIGDYHDLKEESDIKVSELKALERAKKKFAKGSNKRMQVESKIVGIKEQKQDIENDRWELVVKARNSHNVERLRTERQRYLPAGRRLHVFGVSNKHYERLKSDEEPEGFQLSPEGTGIPELRRHLIHLAASRIWNTLKDFVSSEMTALIPAFEMWAGTGKIVNDRTTLVDIVQKQQKQLQTEFEDYQISLMELVEKRIVSALRNNQHKSAASAVSYVQQTLSGLYWATLKAFIQRNGNHRTSVMSDSWNEQFTTESTDVIEKSWVSFTSGREAAVVSLEEKIILAVQAIPKSLRDHEVSGLPMSTFKRGLEGHISGMRQTFRRYDQEFVKELRAIYINSTVDGTDNYFAKAMQEAYQTCRQDSGPGVQARCMSVISTHLSLLGDRSPFCMMATSVGSSIQAATKAQIAAIDTDLDVIFKAILRDVKSMVLKKSQNPSEVRVRKAVSLFVEAGSQKLEDINETMLAIESRYPAESLNN